VRLRAVEALGALGAVPPLERLAREGEAKWVRLKAAEVLGALGAPPIGCEELE